MFQKEFHIDKRVLYQLVECEDNPYYTPSHPFNTQWQNYKPYFTTPSQQQYYKSFMNPFAKNHFMPFLSSEPISNPQR